MAVSMHTDHHVIWRVWSSLYFPKKELRATARMKSSKDAAAQVAKRRAIPRLVVEAINLDFALSVSYQYLCKLASYQPNTLNPYGIYLKLPSFTYIHLLPITAKKQIKCYGK